jgi:hypothetical protein
MQALGDGCNTGEMGQSLIFGLAAIAMFLIIDSGVLYIVIKSIITDNSSYIPYSV